ncbi:MAG: hypothetical protein ACM3X0_09985 [Bacteroidota bacterium]
MKRFLIALTSVAALSAPALAADVGVSVSIGQPGFYGRLDIGGFPPPALLYPQPVMIQPVPMGRPPLYLRVPPGHAKHWDRHCHEYGACGERVYFVQDSWYNREYAPRFRDGYGERRDYRREEYRDGYRGDDRRGRGDDHERGRGNGHGHGHGHDD